MVTPEVARHLIATDRVREAATKRLGSVAGGSNAEGTKIQVKWDDGETSRVDTATLQTRTVWRVACKHKGSGDHAYQSSTHQTMPRAYDRAVNLSREVEEGLLPRITEIRVEYHHDYSEDWLLNEVVWQRVGATR